jgi:hypothetical protein
MEVYMVDEKWIDSEKKIARRVYDLALNQEYTEIIEEFKIKALRVKSSEDLWAMQKYLENAHRDLEARYDFRYSQLIIVFGNLMHRGRIAKDQLKGLSENKINEICRIASIKSQ